MKHKEENGNNDDAQCKNGVRVASRRAAAANKSQLMWKILDSCFQSMLVKHFQFYLHN